MKKLKKIVPFIFVFSLLMLSSCNENEEILEPEVVVKLPDFREIFFGDNSTSKDGEAPLFIITTESDLISAEGGCYLVNVRVYVVGSNGTKWLTANDDVKVGKDCKKDDKNSKTDSCNGILPNGDFVYRNETKDHLCLYEILTKNNEVYKQYLKSIKETIDNN